MPTLQLAIDSRQARIGASSFILELNRIKAASLGTSASLSRLFYAVLGGSAFYKIVDNISKFELNMAKLQGVTGATTDTINALTDAARELGLQGVMNANDVSDALVVLSKAGLEAGAALKAAPAVLALATAQATSFEVATRMTANAMEQFKLGADQAWRVVDTLSKTANASTADIQDLSRSFKFAGVTAATIGLQIEDAGAIITVLAQNAMKASLAGSYFRGVVGSLLKPLKPLRTEMQLLGHDMRDLNPATRPILEIFEDLKDKGFSLETAFKAFGRNLGNAAYVLVNNVDKIREMGAEIRTASGETKKLADLMTDTISGALKRFGAALYEVTLQIGDSGFAKAVKDALKFSRDLVLGMAGLDDAIEGNKNTVMEWARALSAIGSALIARAFIGAVTAATAAVYTFTAALLASPFGSLAAVVATVVGAYVYFKDTIIEVGDKSGSVTDYIIASWEYLRDLMNLLWPSIKKMAGDTLQYLLDTFIAVYNKIIESINTGFAAFGTSWEGILDKIKSGANTAIGLAVTVGSAIRSIAEAASAAADGRWVDALGAKVFDPVSMGLTAFANTSRDWIGEAYQKGKDVKAAFINGLQSLALSQGEDPSKYGSLAAAGDWIVNRADALRQLREETAAAEAEQNALARALLDAGGELNFVDDEFDAATETTEAFTDATAAGVKQLDNLIDRWKIEAQTIALSANARERLSAVMQAQDIIEENHIENGEKYIEILNRQITLAQQAAAVRYVDEELKSLREERSLINLTNEEREIQIKLLQAEEAMRDSGLANKEEYIAALEHEYRIVQRLHAAKAFADEFGRSVADSFGDIILRAKTAEEAVNDFGQTLYRMILNEALQKPIAGIFSNLFAGAFSGLWTASAANGAVFSKGTRALASGGTVAYTPTSVPSATGMSALYGEAGPEAVFPLSRGPDGRLGIAAQTGGGARPIVVNVNVQTPNPNAFRASTAQIASEVKKALGRARLS